MSCAIMLERKYSGSYEKFNTSVSVQELLDAGVRVYWHKAWYEEIFSGFSWRAEGRENTRWDLVRSEDNLRDMDGTEAVINGKRYEGRVLIYCNIRDDELWEKVLAIEEANERKAEEYWRWYRESGKADEAAMARGAMLMGCDPAWYDRQTAPEKQLS